MKARPVQTFHPVNRPVILVQATWSHGRTHSSVYPCVGWLADEASAEPLFFSDEMQLALPAEGLEVCNGLTTILVDPTDAEIVETRRRLRRRCRREFASQIDPTSN